MNPTVNGTTVENNVTVEPLVQVTKEELKRPLLLLLPLLQLRRMLLRTKKSYASIVKVMKEGPWTPFVKPKTASKAVTKAVEGPEKSSVKLSQAAETTPTDRNVVENNTSYDEQGSVFVKSLPFNVTIQMVEEEFKKYGAIKPGGIQVRNNKASPIHMGRKNYLLRRNELLHEGVYRGDNFRRGGGYGNNANYRGGDNFGRRDGSENFNRLNDLRNRNELSGRGQGPPPGNGYHPKGNGFHPPRPFQNGARRFTRVNGPKQAPVAAELSLCGFH